MTLAELKSKLEASVESKENIEISADECGNLLADINTINIAKEVVDEALNDLNAKPINEREKTPEEVMNTPASDYNDDDESK